jgi:hypothetical protein
MPLTGFQAEIARALSVNRTPDSYLAGGAALHIEPNGKRYSNDLDFFHDSVERTASAFEQDRDLLVGEDFQVEIVLSQPGLIRAMVTRSQEATKVEWSHDSAWRFLPAIRSDVCGYQLHPIDLAINKLLALVGRDEPRDLIDTLHVHQNVLALGALCWAAAGKDPGYTPDLLLEILRRRGKVRPEDMLRLHLVEPVDLQDLKSRWLEALEQSQAFVRSRPPHEVGCLYYSISLAKFVQPGEETDIVPHYGRPGGVLPVVVEE